MLVWKWCKSYNLVFQFIANIVFFLITTGCEYWIAMHSKYRKIREDTIHLLAQFEVRRKGRVQSPQHNYEHMSTCSSVIARRLLCPPVFVLLDSRLLARSSSLPLLVRSLRIIHLAHDWSARLAGTSARLFATEKQKRKKGKAYCIEKERVRARFQIVVKNKPEDRKTIRSFPTSRYAITSNFLLQTAAFIINRYEYKEPHKFSKCS